LVVVVVVVLLLLFGSFAFGVHRRSVPIVGTPFSLHLLFYLLLL